METYNQLPKAMMLLNQGCDEDFVASEVLKGLQDVNVYSRYGIAHKIVDKAVKELNALYNKKYEITFLFDGKKEVIQVDARNCAHADYLADEHAIKNDFPTHTCRIKQLEVNN